MRTNPTKKAIFKKLEELNDIFPQKSIGQVFYSYVVTQYPNKNIYCIEDKDLLNLICNAIDKAKELKQLEQEIYNERKRIAKKY